MNISPHPHQIFVRPPTHPRPIQVIPLPKPAPPIAIPSTWHSIEPGDPYDVKKYKFKYPDR